MEGRLGGHDRHVAGVLDDRDGVSSRTPLVALAARLVDLLLDRPDPRHVERGRRRRAILTAAAERPEGEREGR